MEGIDQEYMDSGGMQYPYDWPVAIFSIGIDAIIAKITSNQYLIMWNIIIYVRFI